MPGFASLKTLVERQDSDGAVRYFTWRKTPSVTTGRGFWFDLSMSPGNPVPQYYASAPLTALPLAQSTDGGIYHGAAVTPGALYLRSLTALTVTATAVPLPMILCDYLMHYPFIDESAVGDTQAMTNVNTLTRYTDGAGVQMMAVVVAAQSTGGSTFTVSYTNSSGVAGRTTPAITMGTQSVNGTLLTTAQATAGCIGPFLPLQSGDTGVRSIESVVIGGAGDVGLFTLVLVKPLADLSLRGIDAPVEVDFLKDRPSMPRIYDDAYLNMICLTAGTLAAAPIHGDVSFTWSST